MATFVLLYFTGQTLNVFTLGGLALGRRAAGRRLDRRAGEHPPPPRAWASRGGTRCWRRRRRSRCRSWCRPITTIVVFFPVLFLTGRRAQPVHAAGADDRVRADHELLRVADGDAAAVPVHVEGPPRARRSAACPARSAGRSTRVDNAYARSLGWVLRHRLVTVGAILAVFGVSLFLEALHRDGVLPRQRRVAVRRQLQGADRHARRADRAGRRADRGGGQPDARSTTERADRDDDDRRRRPAARAHGGVLAEHRAALGQHPRQPGAAVGADALGRAGGRVGPGGAARRAAGHAGLLLHRRHREAHPELRRAGPDRHRDRGPRHRGGRRVRQAGPGARCGRWTTRTAGPG